uniref:ASH domain-containing protein n=1 Tax=Strongyloides venezuelensis TaxID=75913 RepID=A0A0K0F8A6_STRVS
MSGLKNKDYNRADNLSRISEECPLTSKENSLSSNSSDRARDLMTNNQPFHKLSISDDSQENKIDSKEFINGSLFVDKLKMDEKKFCQDNVIIQDDPRFNRSRQVKENSWEPSVYEFSSPQVQNANQETPRRSAGRNEIKDKLQVLNNVSLKKFPSESTNDSPSNPPNYFTSTPIRENNLGQSRLFSNFEVPNISTIAVDNSVLFQEFMSNLLKRKNAVNGVNSAKNIIAESASDITKRRRHSSTSTLSISSNMRNISTKEKFLHFGFCPLNCQSILPLTLQNNSTNIIKGKLEFKGKGEIFSLEDNSKSAGEYISFEPNQVKILYISFNPNSYGLYQDTLYIYYGSYGISDKPKQKVPIAGICGTTNISVCIDKSSDMLVKVPNVNLDEYLLKTSFTITKFNFTIKNSGSRKAFAVMIPFKIDPTSGKCDVVNEFVEFQSGSNIVLEPSEEFNVCVSHRIPKLFEILESSYTSEGIEELFRIVIMYGDETQRLRLKEAEKVSKASYNFEGQSLTKRTFINESALQTTFILGDIECEGKILEKGISRSIISFCYKF